MNVPLHDSWKIERSEPVDFSSRFSYEKTGWKEQFRQGFNNGIKLNNMQTLERKRGTSKKKLIYV